MNIITKLTIRHLRLNQGRTAITLLAIMLSVAMITAVTGLVESTRDMLRRTYTASSGDWHVIIFGVTEQQAETVLQDRAVATGYTDRDAYGQLNVRFRLDKPSRQYEQTAIAIAERCGVASQDRGYHKELLAAEGIIAGDATFVMLLSIAAVLIVVIMGGSIIVIANAFYISASERVRQFGLLKSVGATKPQIRASVLKEGVILSFIGIPPGIAVGHLVAFLALLIANYLLTEIRQFNNGLFRFTLQFSPLSVFITAVLSFVTVLLSAWLPARKSAKITAIDAIRQSDAIKISVRQVKTSPLIQKFFGFEGALALKSLGRNRHKYRATVIALVVSVVLFVTGSGFGLLVEKAATYYYPDYNINAYAFVMGQYTEAYRRVADALLQLGGEQAERSYASTFQSADAAQYLTEKAKSAYFDKNETEIFLLVHSLTDTGFAELCDTLKLPADTKAILVNKTYLSAEGRTTEMAPFIFTQGMTVHYGDNSAYTLTIDAQTQEIPRGIITMFRGDAINVVIPERDMLFSDGRAAVWIVTQTEHPAAFAEAAYTLIATLDDPGAGYGIQDIDTMSRLNKNITLLLNIFIMGFVGLLSLIAVTSVIAAISAGMTLRAREFAMLSSVGMTPEGFKRMLNLESLFYGLKALLVGLPLGLLGSYLVYRAMAIQMEYPFSWPWQSMLISVAAVMLLTFTTMRYSRHKMKKVSIVEAIRRETA